MRTSLVLLTLITTMSCQSSIENAKTVERKVSGNCGMCKKRIESAGNQSGLSNVTWDKELKVATIVFDSLKTDESKILELIAKSGYDNEEFVADSVDYNSLHECCQYDRSK